jgi:hypothetical protein
MKFNITHNTVYLFDSEVFLEPHYFRPKQTPYLDVMDFSITILSEPAGHKVIQDEENNILDFVGLRDDY